MNGIVGLHPHIRDQRYYSSDWITMIRSKECYQSLYIFWRKSTRKMRSFITRPFSSNPNSQDPNSTIKLPPIFIFELRIKVWPVYAKWRKWQRRRVRYFTNLENSNSSPLTSEHYVGGNKPVLNQFVNSAFVESRGARRGDLFIEV